MKNTWIRWPLAIFAVVLLSSCGYNMIQGNEEAVFKAWGDLEAQLQRRLDLIPNLVATVKGYASHERETLEAVVNARSKATQTNLKVEDLSDPAAVEKFQAAQGEVSSALSRLLVVVENYPQLKSSENFQRLQDELAGTENRIAVERRKYNEIVQKYNTTIGLFPNNIFAGMLGFQRNDDYFKTEPGARETPKVKF